MKILSIENILKYASFRNKYDLLSNSVSHKIFKIIQEKFLGRINFKESFYEHLEGGEEDYTVDFYVKFNDLYDKKIDVKAKFYYPDEKTEPYIDVRVYLSADFSEMDFERIYWHLYEAIRHEYEHFDKYLKGFWPDSKYNETVSSLDKLNLSDVEKSKLVSQYILDPIEIDAYAKSIIYVAKKRKIPYGSVIQDILNRMLFNNDKNIEKKMMQNPEINRIINDIKNKLVERIQQIFPKTILKDSF